MFKQFRDIGIKLTPQRMVIANLLTNNSTHPSAEDIYHAALEQIPGMSFATVYNTLEIFKEKGAIRELNIDPERKRYDPDTSNHHHLICVKCGKIIDVFDGVDVNVVNDTISEFKIAEVHVEFYGVCNSCEKKNNKE
ncbi:MAG: transcriptional repressor [Candidatus Magnetoovum sp. WYHC-5]|nr:transcriptional repressor [Candidatus Magnetoovum sp. WYHC-5]